MPKPTIIHVNRAFIAANRKDGRERPVYTLKMKGETVYAHGVEGGHFRLVDPRKHKQLPCGAIAWIETDEPVTLIDPCSFADVKRDFPNEAITEDSGGTNNEPSLRPHPERLGSAA